MCVGGVAGGRGRGGIDGCHMLILRVKGHS